MRILMGITVFFPSTAYGGPATVAMTQARELVRRKHEVTVVTSDVLTLRPRAHVGAADATIDGVNVRYFPTRILAPRFPALVSPELKRWLRARVSEFDVVHVHFARDWIPLTVTREALRRERRVVLQPHGMLGKTGGIRALVDAGIAARLLRRAHRVLPLQATEARNIAAIAPRASMTVLPNGIAALSTRPRWELWTLGSRRVLFLARLHPRKRLMDLLAAAQLLLAQGQSIHLRVVGPDEGDLGRARAFVAANGLADHVTFVGPVAADRVEHELAAASVYVLPAVEEPFPMTVLEALAVGVPTIVTSAIHIRELLERHAAARIASPSPAALAAAVAAVLTDPKLAAALSERGRGLVEGHLTIGKVVDRLEAIYSGDSPSAAAEHASSADDAGHPAAPMLQHQILEE